MSVSVEIKKVENGFIVEYEKEKEGGLNNAIGFMSKEKFVADSLDKAITLVKKLFGESMSDMKESNSQNEMEKPKGSGM